MARKDTLNDKEENVLIYLHQHNGKIKDVDGGAKGAEFRLGNFLFVFSNQAIGKFKRMGLIRLAKKSPNVYVIDSAGRTTALALIESRRHKDKPPRAAKKTTKRKPASKPSGKAKNKPSKRTTKKKPLKRR